MVEERLKRLERHIRLLEEFRSRYTAEAIRADEHLQWALRYGLFEASQMVIAIACHVVSARNLGSPSTYGECIDLLVKYGYLDASLGQQVQKMIGLRNILVHEYVRVDVNRLLGYLNRLDDFRAFLRAMEQHV